MKMTAAGAIRNRRDDCDEEKNVVQVHNAESLRFDFWCLKSNADGYCRSYIMRITITDYLDVVSSWCFWSEPTWAELKRRYEGRVEFQWKIALMDPSGLPTSREQEQWFYRRSGMMMRSPFMLNTDWYDASLKEWLALNSAAEAAKDFGVTDDRVRLAIAQAALRQGKKVSDWSVCAEVAASAGNLDKKKLLDAAQ